MSQFVLVSKNIKLGQVDACKQCIKHVSTSTWVWTLNYINVQGNLF